MIYVYGDSHSWGFKTVPQAAVNHTGSHTMYRIGRDGEQAFRTRHNQRDVVVWVYGEIDCRCHISRIAQNSRHDEWDIIRPLVECYCEKMQTRMLRDGIIGVLACVMPPSDLGHTEYLPVYGPLQQRIDNTQKVNTYMQQQCDQRGIKFLDYYQHFSTPEGSLDHNKSDGLLHIAEHQWPVVAAELEKLLNGGL